MVIKKRHSGIYLILFGYEDIAKKLSKNRIFWQSNPVLRYIPDSKFIIFWTRRGSTKIKLIFKTSRMKIGWIAN